MSGTHGWHDDPVRSARDDRFGRSHVAQRVARLISESHTWDSSLVFGLTGPWGSGKSSLIEMICESLGTSDVEWSIARFTPWATTSTESLLAEFYAALSSSLPKDGSKAAKRALAACAQVASPLLGLVPGVGGALSRAADMGLRALERRPAWDGVFTKSADELKALGRPVLVVADDIDRLQPDELAAFLKVVRLLGRFPGVSYLIAYDEDTLFAHLQGVDASIERGRRFMEKIVQYPIAVPPLLPNQALTHLDAQLSSLLERLERPMSGTSTRVARLADVFERQLTTPRSIDRFLAQVELFLSMHDREEIDDVDLILLTFIRVQFPGLYALLPRWRRQLTASPSIWQQARQQTQPDWDDLLAVVDAATRSDARDLLQVVFPAMSRSSVETGRRRGASHPDYFSRYFLHTVPEGDVADAEITKALNQAGVEGANHSIMHGLLTSTVPNLPDLALSKLWNASIPHRGEAPPVTLSLLRAVVSEIEGLKGGTNSLFRRQERALAWAAELMLLLPEETTPTELLDTLATCRDLPLRMHLLWLAASPNREGSPGARDKVMEAARSTAADVLTEIVDHLRQRDSADVTPPTVALLNFVAEFGDKAAAREAILAGIDAGDFTTEDLASRCVGIAYRVAKDPVPHISSFESATFALFAPEDDPLYREPILDSLDEWDVTWTNRRAYARGRAEPATPTFAEPGGNVRRDSAEP